MASLVTTNKNKIMGVAQSGMMIALMIVVQLLAFVVPKSIPLVSQIFTGSLVNFVLIIGAATVGFTGTVSAAILSPVLAFAFGQMLFPQLIPVIAIGNSVIVAVTWFFFRHDNLSKKSNIRIDLLGIVAGAVAKTAFLWAVISWIILPSFFAGKVQIAQKLGFMFSWPQFITAIIGGVIALLILPVIQTYRKNRE